MTSMENNKLLSVIIPLYNSERFIESTLLNLLSANIDFRCVEIVLVDDGSTDKTQYICQKYINNYSFIKYFKKANGGIDSARNYGLLVSSGKYVFFHDHDDLFNAALFGEILDILVLNESDIFLFEANKKQQDKIIKFITINKKYAKSLIKDSKQKESIFKTMMFINNDNEVVNRYGFIWSVIIKKEFVLKNNITFKIRCDYEDDFTFLLDCLLNDASFFCVPLNIYQWNVLDDSFSHKKKYDISYLDKVDSLLSYYSSVISDSVFCKYKMQAISNLSWRKARDFVLLFCRSDDPLNTYKNFLHLCKTYSIRKKILFKVYFKKTFRQQLFTLLFKMRMYRICYMISK